MASTVNVSVCRMRLSVAILAVALGLCDGLVPNYRTARPLQRSAVVPQDGTLRQWRLPTRLTAASLSMPRISDDHLQELDRNGYVVVQNFLPESLQEGLRADIQKLRSSSRFNVAKIGQDSTNALNTDIRVAETCFLGPDKLSDMPDDSRSAMYQILDQVRRDLPKQLDGTLSELLYAYYPSGGFYRRHRDAIPGSASTLREYSLLLYLNRDWKDSDGGRLRMHFDSGGDVLPEGEEANYRDVDPQGRTLVLFKSDQVPHEVLDTTKERMAVVGWYNRPVTAGDIAALSGGDGTTLRVAALALALVLITVGLAGIIS